MKTTPQRNGMTKIFIDIGTHNGNSIEKAVKEYPDFDKFYGYEPITSLCKKARNKFTNDKRVHIYNVAVDVQEEDRKTITIYEDHIRHKLGTTFYKDKKVGRLKPTKCECVNVDYIFKHVSESDYVILKIDVEGKEYDILEHLLATGQLTKYVDKIFCEWHSHKIPSLSKNRHDKLVALLNKAGFPLTGDSKKDEFYVGF